MDKLLDDNEIEYLSVNCRIKEFESFFEKIDRKKYNHPFEDTNDICGLRIICYYPSDLDKIAQIINDEFNVIESIDKGVLLDPDRFGYISLHFVVKIRDEWTITPQYKDLNNLKVEIQVRTILMHAWADIEHKFAYKKKEHVPNQFKRELYRLSALFEIADQKFDSLRKHKNRFSEELYSSAMETKRFDVNQDLNLDTLQAFLDYYFPDRDKDRSYTVTLLDEFLRFNEENKNQITFELLVETHDKMMDALPKLEEEFLKECYEKTEIDNFKLAQVGATRKILDETVKDYKTFREEYYKYADLDTA